MSITLAQSDRDIERCFPVMRQLRPKLAENRFVETVRRLEKTGFQMAYLEERGKVISVAGFRILENLASGRFLYVDDLITDEAARSRGHGQKVFERLVDYAKGQGCRQVELDSGVQRFGAHRFYLGRRMSIKCHHFELALEEDSE